MKPLKMAMVLSGLMMIGMAGIAPAAGKIDIGKQEYEANCAACHGPSGKGDGYYAEMLKVRMTDLTVLSKNNNGVFPFAHVYEVIDGRQQVRAHGTREMPIWGADYRTIGDPYHGSYAPESVVAGRILALIDYLHRLQVK